MSATITAGCAVFGLRSWKKELRVRREYALAEELIVPIIGLQEVIKKAHEVGDMRGGVRVKLKQKIDEHLSQLDPTILKSKVLLKNTRIFEKLQKERDDFQEMIERSQYPKILSKQVTKEDGTVTSQTLPIANLPGADTIFLNMADTVKKIMK